MSLHHDFQDLQRLDLDTRLVTLLDPSTFEAEQYRRLRHQVTVLRTSHRCRVVAVTSAAAGEGKTLTAINLAGALAESPYMRTLLIDADLRRPALHRHFRNLEGEAEGLDGALREPTRIVSLARPVPDTRLAVLTTLPRRRGAYDVLSSTAFAQLVDEARRQFDFVVIDAAPIVAVPDALALQPVIDAYIVVVAAQATPKRLLGDALSMLDERMVLGLVFNRDDAVSIESGYYRQHVRDYASTSATAGR